MLKLISIFFVVASFVYTGSEFVQGMGVLIPDAIAKTDTPPNNWLKIPEFKMDGVAAYYNSNSFSIKNHGQFNRVEIMMAYDDPITIKLNGKDHVIRSVVKSLAAECDIGVMAPIYDMYFNVQFPTKDTLPVAGKEYPTDYSKTATEMPKNSIFYRIMCSESI